ncbi:hypothetical protein K439DRAFT_1646697 [Ramaria rubella]|nr:hypothetical protein K439DRAFT_1646697 [Ramaria rubella]
MQSVPPDVLEFLKSYPEQRGHGDGLNCNDNLKFYSNLLCCRPDGLLIDDLHERWNGDYATLEREHGFIQWLFPIQEYGINFQSQPLQRHEITAMKNIPEVIARILTSYRLMLDFYGLRLVNPETGLLDRVLPPRDCHARYRNLTRCPHNYLRITRILKCLSEFGLERMNAAFILFLLYEQCENMELNTTGLRSSMDRWRFVRRQIEQVREGGKTWTREAYENALMDRKQYGHFIESRDVTTRDTETA